MPCLPDYKNVTNPLDSAHPVKDATTPQRGPAIGNSQEMTNHIGGEVIELRHYPPV